MLSGQTAGFLLFNTLLFPTHFSHTFESYCTAFLFIFFGGVPGIFFSLIHWQIYCIVIDFSRCYNLVFNSNVGQQVRCDLPTWTHMRIQNRLANKLDWRIAERAAPFTISSFSRSRTGGNATRPNIYTIRVLLTPEGQQRSRNVLVYRNSLQRCSLHSFHFYSSFLPAFPSLHTRLWKRDDTAGQCRVAVQFTQDLPLSCCIVLFPPFGFSSFDSWCSPVLPFFLWGASILLRPAGLGQWTNATSPSILCQTNNTSSFTPSFLLILPDSFLSVL